MTLMLRRCRLVSFTAAIFHYFLNILFNFSFYQHECYNLNFVLYHCTCIHSILTVISHVNLETWLASCPLIFCLYLFLMFPSSQDKSELSVSLLTTSHHILDVPLSSSSYRSFPHSHSLS